MLKICLVFWKSEPQYAYKKKHVAHSRFDFMDKNVEAGIGNFEKIPKIVTFLLISH